MLQNTEEKLLYCTNCHRNAWNHLISLFHYSQLRFYHAKPPDTLEEDRQVLEFVNPVVDSIDEDNNIFEPERGICVSRPPTLALARSPGSNLNDGPGPQFVFTGPAPQFLFILCFTVKVCHSQPRFQCVFSLFFKTALETRLCYSYSVYLYKLSV